MPIAPVPAKRSSTLLPAIRSARILKRASRTRSQVGRMWAWPDLGAASLRPRALPPVMRKGEGPERMASGLEGWVFQVDRHWLLLEKPGLDGQDRTGQDIEEKGGKQGFLRVAGQQDQQ